MLLLVLATSAHASGSSFPSLWDLFRAIFAPNRVEVPDPISREELIIQERAYRAQQAASEAKKGSTNEKPNEPRLLDGRR